jgi:hypothetical protein
MQEEGNQAKVKENFQDTIMKHKKISNKKIRIIPSPHVMFETKTKSLKTANVFMQHFEGLMCIFLK